MADLENPNYEDLDLKIDDSETESFWFDDTEWELDALWGDPKKQFDRLVKRIGTKGCSCKMRLDVKIDGETTTTRFNKVTVSDSKKYTKINVKYGLYSLNVFYLRYNKKTKKFEKCSSDRSSRKEITDKEAKKRIGEIDWLVTKIKTWDIIESWL